MALSETAGRATTPASGRASFLYDPKVRGAFFQAMLALVVAILIWFAATNAIENLARLHMASGFGFFSTTAGFDISQRLIEYGPTSTYARAFWVGLLNTALVSVIGIVLATLVGFTIGIARLSPNWVIRQLATWYVEGLRNVPLLLQLFFWYGAVLAPLPAPKQSIALPGDMFLNARGLFFPTPVFEAGSWLMLVGLIVGIVAAIGVWHWARARQMATGQQFPIGWTALGLIVGLPILALIVTGFPISFDKPVLSTFNLSGGTRIFPEFIALLLGLSLYTGAFIAEIVRAGILAIHRGQTEASNALGLRAGPTLQLVIIPQALRVIVPPLTSQYLNLIKNSSLAVAIGYPDLVSVFTGTTLNQTGQAIEVIAITMLVYLSISLSVSAFMNWYNSLVALKER